MTYRVNKVDGKITLFRGGSWDGVGNFCGWYAVEYYTNTFVVGYIEPFDENSEEITFTAVNEFRDRVNIYSCMIESHIEANTDYEAENVLLTKVLNGLLA